MGNLAHETTEADLQAAFTPFGKVVSTKVMSDRRGRAKGFGYVEMADDDSAREAMDNLRGKELNGRLMDIVMEDRRGKKGGPPRRRR
ncbi:MAG TPA: RNA-binding protein [Dehalococcoidia bacterium]|nr:RNA-binding protein [Dehalococcoidia bacterium]